MGFFKRLFGMGPSKPDTRFLPFYVYSQRCNEPLAGKIDTMNELSVADASDAEWYARKVVQTAGRGRCFDQIEVQIWFDAARMPIRRDVTGGLWLEFDEYDRLVKARASTLVDDAPGAESSPHADSSETPGGNQNAA